MCKKVKHVLRELVKHIYWVLDSNQTQWMTIINKKKGIHFYLVSSCFICKEKISLSTTNLQDLNLFVPIMDSAEKMAILLLFQLLSASEPSSC